MANLQTSRTPESTLHDEGDGHQLSPSSSSSSSASSSTFAANDRNGGPSTRRPQPRPRAQPSGCTSSFNEKSHHDGHRPCDLEMQRTSSRATGRDDNGCQLRRTMSRRDTILSKIRSRPSVPPFSHPLAHVPTTEEQLVDYEGPDDPYHPLNWPTKKKVLTTLLYGFVTMTATWASSSYAAGTEQIATQFRVSKQVATLGTSLYLMGFGVGPLLWAPLSEVYGRRAAVLSPMFIAMCFSFASATAKDLQTLMLTRFFGALFASAPVTNTGGVLGDLYTPAYRGIAMAGYAMAVVGGPTLGPIVSAALVSDPSLGWRWTEYVTGMLQAFVLFIAVLVIDESYPPRLLVDKARRLRHDTGNWALHARFEEWDVGVGELARKFLVRPLQLIATPICFLVALYASFCYGILYMQLGAIPFIFGVERGWPAVSAVLPFLAILLGAITGAVINTLNQLVYNRSYHAAGDRAVPEKRLPPMMLGSVLFAVGQFVTGWTAGPATAHWMVPVFGLYLTGCGFNTIFQAALNYLVDTFQMYAASAVAANTFLRSCFAAAFPLVVGPLYSNLGVGPGSSIFAGFAVLLVPVPFVFYVFGERLRAANKWSKASVVV
ncbi:polyamine transporter 1 [Verticillium alfalfae VaMs.102]|uniref:Polyamine transporter 1 n=1 Tax=Verticillium alfalfae (strain VaMs.102 / ATCC MYA-4576 / FGSC 10136) TaxID=526221 RepID=C9SEY3_VERA1|nr:polyamine transporter 1 [Verticillium alfalfae VaMs.102]EEY17769.1 polyamine transporter 1 [Verticillium alfalfae VaMs.102]